MSKVNNELSNLQIKTILNEAWKNVTGVKIYYFIATLLVLGIFSGLNTIFHFIMSFAVFLVSFSLFVAPPHAVLTFPMIFILWIILGSIFFAGLFPLGAGIVQFGLSQAMNESIHFNSMFSFYQKKYILRLFLVWIYILLIFFIPLFLIESGLFTMTVHPREPLNALIPMFGLFTSLILIFLGVSVCTIWTYPYIMFIVPMIIYFSLARYLPYALSIHSMLIWTLVLVSILWIIYWLISLYFVYPLIIDKNLTAWKAIKTSIKLSHKNWIKIFMLFICMILLNPGLILFLIGFFQMNFFLIGLGTVLILGSFLWIVPFSYNVLGITYRNLALDNKDLN